MGFLFKLLLKVAPLAAVVGVFSEDVQKNLQAVANWGMSAMVQMEVNAQRDQLIVFYQGRQSFPSDYAAWVKENMHSAVRDASLDYWHNEYHLEFIRDGFIIRSCGPDAECGSDDDISADFIGLTSMRER